MVDVLLNGPELRDTWRERGRGGERHNGRALLRERMC